jgi:hypothetical protein
MRAGNFAKKLKCLSQGLEGKRLAKICHELIISSNTVNRRHPKVTDIYTGEGAVQTRNNAGPRSSAALLNNCPPLKTHQSPEI